MNQDDVTRYALQRGPHGYEIHPSCQPFTIEVGQPFWIECAPDIKGRVQEPMCIAVLKTRR